MKILDFIEQERAFFDTRTIPLPGDKEYSQSKLIFSINCSRLSKYIDDNAKDDIIGDYPYDNISKYRIRLEARSTDIDPKDIEVEPVDGSREARVSAMIATKALQRYMRKYNFGHFLNQYADTRPEYGGFLAKKTNSGIHKVPWENAITDMSNIIGGVIIERHHMLPSELKKTNWSNVDVVIQSAAKKLKEKDMEKAGPDVQTITKTIEVWEMHGEVSKDIYDEALALIDNGEYNPVDGDSEKFVRCQIIVAPEGKDDKGNMQGKVLKVNEEAETIYKYEGRNRIAGRGLGEGLPEELKEHQRWHNFYKTEEARAVAIGGKIVFVTDDPDVADSIYDEGIEHGTILKVGKDAQGNRNTFQQANTLPTSVPMYQNIRNDWDVSGDKVSNSFNANLGEESKSNVPFKAQYLQDVNGNSQFLQYGEEMRAFVREIIEDWALKDALSEAANDNQIYETFSRAELQLIDEVIIAKAQLEHIHSQLIVNKRAVSPQELEAVKIGTQLQLQKGGTKRSIEAIKDFIKKEVVGKVVIHTSDEMRSKANLYESYSNLLGTLDPTSPEYLALVDKVMDMVGVSRETLALYAEEANAKKEQMQQAQQPQKPALPAPAPEPVIPA